MEPEMRRRSQLHELFTDGITVWVNSKECLAGRFGRFGVDVHVQGHCLPDTCTTSWRQSVEDWRRFQLLMLQHHNVDVPDSLMPKWLEANR